MTAIARRYARALFDATPEADRDQVASQLAAIDGVLKDESVANALRSPDLTDAAREKVCGKLVEGGHPILGNFVKVLLERRREDVLFVVEPEYRRLLRAARGEVEGIVETAKPLDDATKTALEETASRLTGQKVILRVEEKPELIGGVRMRVGNTLFDSSVATAIDELERQLRSAPIGG